MLPIPTEKVSSSASFPLEPYFEKASKNVGAETIFQIEELPFQHACVRLPDQISASSPQEASEKLEALYNKLMDYLDLQKVDSEGSKLSYNFLMTEKFMWISPRQHEKAPFGSISVNSVGFTGAILVKSEEDLKILKEAGPLQVLKSVTFPK